MSHCTVLFSPLRRGAEWELIPRGPEGRAIAEAALGPRYDEFVAAWNAKGGPGNRLLDGPDGFRVVLSPDPPTIFRDKLGNWTGLMHWGYWYPITEPVAARTRELIAGRDEAEVLEACYWQARRENPPAAGIPVRPA